MDFIKIIIIYTFFITFIFSQEALADYCPDGGKITYANGRYGVTDDFGRLWVSGDYYPPNLKGFVFTNVFGEMLPNSLKLVTKMYCQYSPSDSSSGDLLLTPHAPLYVDIIGKSWFLFGYDEQKAVYACVSKDRTNCKFITA